MSFVADIIVRFYKQQPEAYDPSEFRGVVIVDEIDLHLHPQGQKDLILALSEVFPNIQFIVSTHSPIPLLAAPRGSLIFRVIRSQDEGITLERLDEKIDVEKFNPNLLLTSPIFGLKSIFPINDKDIQRISTKDNYNDYEFQKIVQEKLNNFLNDQQ